MRVRESDSVVVMKQSPYGLLGMFLLGALWGSQCYGDNIPTYPPVPDPNIITFADAAQKCGGAVMCSSSTGVLPSGTQGYLNDGTGVAFHLSTITQWFQIDPDGVSHLANQPAEPDGGAGGFLVLNDTGAPVTTFSLTLTDTFTSGTASVGPCKAGPQSGKDCDNFQIHGGSAYPFNVELSGADINDCTQGTAVGPTCVGQPGGAAADFAPNQVTYTWTPTTGVSIPAGGMFDITFASWNNDVFAGGTTGGGTTGGGTGGGSTGGEIPEPTSILLLGSTLTIISVAVRKKKAIRS